MIKNNNINTNLVALRTKPNTKNFASLTNTNTDTNNNNPFDQKLDLILFSISNYLKSILDAPAKPHPFISSPLNSSTLMFSLKPSYNNFSKADIKEKDFNGEIDIT